MAGRERSSIAKPSLKDHKRIDHTAVAVHTIFYYRRLEKKRKKNVKAMLVKEFLGGRVKLQSQKKVLFPKLNSQIRHQWMDSFYVDTNRMMTESIFALIYFMK